MLLRAPKHHGGYISRATLLRNKIRQAGDALTNLEREAHVARVASVNEASGIRDRLEKLRLEVGLVTRLDREGQEVYRARLRELDDLGG